jgi:hypothetical protein
MPEDAKGAGPSAGRLTEGIPPDGVTSFCRGVWVRAADPSRAGKCTRRPQREHGLLLTSHSLPQRGQVILALSLSLTDCPALSTNSYMICVC